MSREPYAGAGAAELPTEAPTGVALRDLMSEVLAGALQRPGRTALTMLGTVLGVAAFVAILGLTSTASGQISTDFTVQAATQVTIDDAGSTAQQQERFLYDFPAAADQTIEKLNGVVHAGRTWLVTGGPVAVATTDNPATALTLHMSVYAGSPGYLQALDPILKSGSLYNQFHAQRGINVAVLGAAAAAQLGIASVAEQPAISVSGNPYAVVGILQDVKRSPEALLNIFISDTSAMAQFGKPATASPATMLIETKLGAATLVARQAAIALRPDQPQLLRVVPPADPHALKDTVTASLNSLFVVLAGIALLVGAAGIANTTLVAVMERTPEIGLRRAVGARRHQIATQFLLESAAVGTLGGLIGTALGVGSVLAVALNKSWTAILEPALTLPAPLIGTLTGLIAGTYPAVRAARIEPLEALQR
jgi:putative ABC transport system permease protein